MSELERVTQSGVSRALARLEAEVGTPLLRGSGRMLRMTRAGSAFRRYADAMLHRLDDGLAAVNQLIEPETGTVALAFELSLGTWLMPDLVSSFRADHPHVQLELKQVRGEFGDVSAGPGRGRPPDLDRSEHGPNSAVATADGRAAAVGSAKRPSARTAGYPPRRP